MLHARSLFVFICSILTLAVPVLARADEPKTGLKKGDRIVFLGDSITQGATGKEGYITLIKNELTEKHKDLEIDIIGAGISGNKVPDLQARVDKDVVAKKPTIVFIYIGINDVWHGQDDPAKGTSPEKFEAGLREVIGKITKGGARVILCTPSVIGEKTDGTNKNDKKLDEYSDISRKVAKDLNLQVCDLRKEFIAKLKDKNKDNKDKGVLTGDGVHLNADGNRVVADAMLKVLLDSSK
jgi:lysophospholipase L1-like esterase